MLLEVACFNLESCLIAQNARAQRVELCKNYSAGGITPDYITITESRKQLHLDLFVMIRPREGHFLYTEPEFEKMKSQILFCKTEKCDGIVFGILTSENKVDRIRCLELVELAKPMQCTFHRAFDEIENSEQALEEIIECGFTRLLTSGKEKTALEGAKNISELIQKAQGRITIMPGGGIRSATISELMKTTTANEFHSSAITTKRETADANEIIKLLSAS